MPIELHSDATSRRVMTYLNTQYDADWQTTDMHAMDAPQYIAAGSTKRIDPTDGSDSFAVSSTYKR